MKNLLLTATFIMACVLGMKAQVSEISSDITANRILHNDTIYLIKNFVYVTNNATLTIEPGTLIKGDQATKGTLIITRGAKIMAEGNRYQPIVFTSNQPAGSRSYGDWGGLVILGKAPVNDPAGEKIVEGGLDPVKALYGGTDANDNSGILKFVRVEFPGIAFQPNNEINGITLGGVGSGTTMEYVQVSYSGDDSYEWFGGTVNAKHLIAHRAWDDDFDSDAGWQGKVQFAVVLRDSSIADVSGSNGFESDNDGSGTTNTPYTAPVFSNVSIFGPKINANTIINPDYKRALHLRRSTKTSVYNSVFTGYPTGLKIDGTNTATNVTAGELEFKNNILAGMSTPLDSTNLNFGMYNWFTSSANANTILANSTDVMVANPYNYDNPGFTPLAGSPLLSGASFTSAKLTDPFFTTVTYRGAFGTYDWTEGWAEFNPQMANYTLPGIGLGVEKAGTIEGVRVYPNPAQSAAALEITLAKTETLNITIFDMQGKMVAEVANNTFAGGNYAFNIDMSHVQAGIYFVKINTATASKTVKMVVTK